MTFVVVQSFVCCAALVMIILPETDSQLWIWRAVISGSVALNLFFLRGVYRRISLVDKHARRIGNIETAVKLLARDSAHYHNRKSDAIILSLIELLESPEEKETT